MTTIQKTIGKRAEDYALNYLKQKGLRLIQRNFSCYFGEIDLIMKDTEHIVFVEVRSRTRSSYGNAVDSVTPDKIHKLIRTATIFLQFNQLLHNSHSRFDLVAIDFTKSEKDINWIKNAFTAN